MSAAAQLAGVGVRRGDRWILDNVNLDVLDDQRWVLVGPNGAGKTTLLQVLGAQLHPLWGWWRFSTRYSVRLMYSNCDRGSEWPVRS
ncbi:ABC transporter [Cutibacterium acnes JCM 18918]|nr:ABC transporter [Cutibacterium acnes JCM 18918]